MKTKIAILLLLLISVITIFSWDKKAVEIAIFFAIWGYCLKSVTR